MSSGAQGRRTTGPVRRAQLITPFGVGAMHVLPDGITVVTCGLDHWYPRMEDNESVDEAEFKFQEWRLGARLRVSHFRLPPDYRQNRRRGYIETHQKNVDLSVPVHRFPRWHRCVYCNRMKKFGLHHRDESKCENKKCKGNKEMLQSDLVVACSNGHLGDFPYLEWLHDGGGQGCEDSLTLTQTFGWLKCDRCGEKKQIPRWIVNDRFPCSGGRPWLGKDSDQTDCTASAYPSLKLRLNLYYSHLVSSLALPQRSGISDHLRNSLRNVNARVHLEAQKDMGASPEQLIGTFHRLKKGKWTEKHIGIAMEEEGLIPSATGSTESDADQDAPYDDPETDFRLQEWEIISKNTDEEDLHVKEREASELQFGLHRYFDKVMGVEKLCETTAFVGFSRRLYGQIPDRGEQLWKHYPGRNRDWLPAIKNRGEGILLGLNETELRIWEQRTEVKERVDSWRTKYKDNMESIHGHYDFRVALTPRLVLLHTLAHLIIQEMTMASGYAAASLRERLYVSDVSATQMAGILIYTATGDSEGTMGGLVRMAEPNVLSGILKSAIEKAVWCSNDPICREIGESGQGPQGCNLAACYSCALIPETACEHGNTFLDRTVTTHPDLGFFSGLDFL